MARIAVIDVETTGFCATRSDRIVEIAVVVLDERDGVVSEFVSLINPDRDVGPTRVHGITAGMVRNAPRFGDILGTISATLQGAVAIAGHNVIFDLSFITLEFARCGHTFPEIPSICSMQLAGGGTLESVCFDYDVPRPAIAHSALCDARATAMILQRMLDSSDELSSYIRTLPTPEWPTTPRGDIPPLSRQNAEHESGPDQSYLQNLARRVHGIEIAKPSGDPSPQIAYAALLARAMQDRFIANEESAALISLADTWGLTVTDIASIHRQFLAQLQVAALADGVISEAERTDLRLAAKILGIDGGSAENALDDALGKMASEPRPSTRERNSGGPSGPSFLAKTVCFTGESLCRIQGQYLSRSMALSLAAEKGIDMTDSLTKKVELLVVADPHTQSGKAQKARKYGIPLMQEFVFWRAIGVNVE